MRDLYSNLAGALALAPVVAAASVNGLAVDVSAADGAVFMLQTGAIVGSAVAGAKLQESDDGSTWVDVAAKWVASNAPATLGANAAYRLGYTGKRKSVRLVITLISGTSIAVAAVAVLDPLRKPVA